MDERELYIILKEELEQTRSLRDELESVAKGFPTGTLQIMTKKGRYTQFYQHSKVGKHETVYIARENKNLVQALAQKDYTEKEIKILNERIKVLEKTVDKYRFMLKDVFSNLSDIRKKLVIPNMLPDDLYIKQWYDDYPGEQNTIPKKNEFLTERGEMVRSKSEKIIADKLYRYHIPYVYEPCVLMDTYEKFTPDFAALNVRLRKTFYYEHFGNMDNTQYVRNNMEKINSYMYNGIWPGDNFLFTMENQDHPLDVRLLDQIIKRKLL